VAPAPGITVAPVPAPVDKPATPIERPAAKADSVTPAPAAQATRPANGSDNLTVERLADLWTQIRLDVKTIDRRIEALLAATDPYDVDGKRVLLTTPYEFHCQRLNSDTERHVIADVIGRIVGEAVEVSCYQRGQEPPRVARSAATTPPVNAAPNADPGAEASPPPVTGGNLPDPTPPDEDGVPNSAHRSARTSSASGISDERLKAAMSIFDAEPIDDLPIP
jgi:hypothetical protein